MTDSLISIALQSRLASSGLDWIKLDDLHLDSKANTITVEFTLEGEHQPVKAEVRYSLGAEDVIVIREVTTNRKWMNEAIKLVLVKTGNRFPLPGGLKGRMIRVLL
jgi:hypothetical protein